MIDRLKSLGYKNIYHVNENYTSQKCSFCGNQTELKPDSRYRIKMCTQEGGCGITQHRDVMAAHNMVNIMEGYLYKGGRPDYLPVKVTSTTDGSTED